MELNINICFNIADAAPDEMPRRPIKEAAEPPKTVKARETPSAAPKTPLSVSDSTRAEKIISSSVASVFGG